MMKRLNFLSLVTIAAFSLPAIAPAQSVGNLLSTPVVAVGNGITGLAGSHAGIAPLVNQTSPTAEAATDGVTNAIAAVGAGVTGAGGDVQNNGVRVGTSASGGSLVSIGTRNPALQGSVAAIANGH